MDKDKLLSILDVSKTLMLVTNYDKTTYANKTLLDFVDCSTLEEFDERGGLGSFVLPFEETFYYEKPFKEWVSIAKAGSEANNITYKVYMMNNELDIKTFGLSVVSVPNSPDEIFITLSDITKEDQDREKSEGVSHYDELTKIFNRKKFNEVVEKEFEFAQEYGLPLSVVIIDIDHFKSVNDTYGHLVGDETLKGLVGVVTRNIRGSDLFCRYGGEEFVLLMAKATAEIAQVRMDSVRKAVEENIFSTVEHITCSFGISQVRDDDTIESFVERADSALYEAKKTGRNKVVAYTNEEKAE